MAKSLPSLAEAAMLKWCRNNARLTTAEVAAEMEREESEIIEWENGTSSPTFAQLARFAKLCKRPVAVFWLPEPPKDFTILKDFRRLHRDREERKFSSPLAYLIRTCRERQEWLSAVMRQEGAKPLKYVGSFDVDGGSQKAGMFLRKLLGATLESQFTQSGDDGGFRYWRSLCEEIGVCVFVATRARVATDEMRGFALVDKIAPVVVVNGAERSYAARTFTLLHEMAHILLGIEGISDMNIAATPRTDDQKTEVFCNAVAAEALVPSDDIRRRALSFGSRHDAALAPLAAQYRVSEQVIARRLADLKIVTREFYERKLLEFAARQTTDLDEEQQELPIPMATRVLNSVGKRFSQVAVAAFRDGEISGPVLADLLNMRLQHLSHLENKLQVKTAV